MLQGLLCWLVAVSNRQNSAAHLESLSPVQSLLDLTHEVLQIDEAQSPGDFSSEIRPEPQEREEGDLPIPLCFSDTDDSRPRKNGIFHSLD